MYIFQSFFLIAQAKLQQLTNLYLHVLLLLYKIMLLNEVILQ